MQKERTPKERREETKLIFEIFYTPKKQKPRLPSFGKQGIKHLVLPPMSLRETSYLGKALEQVSWL
jgi:hypothetical protein